MCGEKNKHSLQQDFCSSAVQRKTSELDDHMHPSANKAGPTQFQPATIRIAGASPEGTGGPACRAGGELVLVHLEPGAKNGDGTGERARGVIEPSSVPTLMLID